MSYIDIAMNPYRGNLSEEIGYILAEDHEAVCRTIKSRGLIFLVAYITMMSMSFLKVMYHIFDHYNKPERPVPQITREMLDKSRLNVMYELKEAGNHNSNQCKFKHQEGKLQSTLWLRHYLYTHDLTLEGCVIKEVNHKVDDHAFISSIISGDMAKFTTTYVTFGEDIDERLSDVLPSRPKIRKVQGQKCLAFENDYGFMVQELRQIYQEPIKVKFDRI